jgi:hypothetical protein
MPLVEEKDGGKIISIAFDEIFGQDISHLNDFSLAIKRNFVNASEQIVEALNYLFDNSSEIAAGYLQIQHFMRKYKKDYTQEEFENDIHEQVFTQEVVDVISNYVEESYTVNLDEETRKARNANEELQFTDHHAKIILKVSMASKAVIPLITEYLSYRDEKKNEDLFFVIFSKLYHIFEGEDVDIMNKIFKLIDSRIIATRYSDKIIWSYLKNLSLDSNVLTRQFYRKVIINIVPKLMNNTNIVSYLHVVLKNLIKYQFTINFPISYKPLNLNQTDSEGLSDFDKLEVNMIRIDEGINIINKLTIKREIRNLMKKFNIVVSKEEFEYYKEKIVINKLQTNLLFLFFSKYMGSYNNNYNANFDEYIMMCIIMRRWLKENNFPVLYKYITAQPEKYIERKSINKKQFLGKLMSSRKYKNLLNGKYGFVIQNLVDSGVIIKIIATLKTNKFYNVPDYEEHLLGYTEEPLDEKIEDISDEFLSLIERV